MSNRRFSLALLAIGACVESPALRATESEVAVDVAGGGLSAGSGWFNGPIPQLDFGVITVAFTVSGQGTTPIDAVFGLANGPADAFADLGPIVRLNTQGFVDVRDGGTYRADNAFDYRGKDLHVTITADLGQRTYSVDIDSTRIATSYAFRTEQSAMSRVDTLAATIDSAQGSVMISEVDVGPSNCAFAGQSWVTQAYPAQHGRFIAQVDARVPQLTDAVVGLSAGAPLGFTDLATIVRFRPDGLFDARDGSGYRADQAIAYSPNQTYRFTMIVDLAAKRYSVNVGDPYGSGLGPTLATAHAFRTEQAGVTELSRIGSFTDGPGYVHTCYLNVWNHW
jgi:unsaturated chondroitin disaccharide hydrolase